MGSAYVFQQSGTTWTQQTQLAPIDGMPGDEFGYSVAVHGPTVLVGSWGQAGAIGAAYLFASAATDSNQITKLTAADGAISDFFGWSVALAGDTAIVGAYGESGLAGAAYIFENPSTVGLRLSYRNGNLVIGYTVGAADPGRWTGWLLSSAAAKRLWQERFGGYFDAVHRILADTELSKLGNHWHLGESDDDGRKPMHGAPNDQHRRGAHRHRRATPRDRGKSRVALAMTQ